MLCDLSNIGQVESTDKTDVAAAFELMQDELFFWFLQVEQFPLQATVL